MESTISDLYDSKTLYIIGGSTTYFRLHLYDDTEATPLDLTNTKDIEWKLTTFSVKESKAIFYKNMQSGIQILKDEKGKLTNVVQVAISSEDTKDLQGAFLHQISLQDTSGKRFVAFQGLIIIDKYIQS